VCYVDPLNAPAKPDKFSDNLIHATCSIQLPNYKEAKVEILCEPDVAPPKRVRPDVAAGACQRFQRDIRYYQTV
jgi:hypothetical protein